MLAWRLRGRRGLCLGLLGVLCPSTAWSTLYLQASHVALLCCSSGATIHLSWWPHVLQSAHVRLLHLELYSRLGLGSHASTKVRLGTSPMSVPSLGRVSLLGHRHRLSVSQRLWSAHRL
jgi:hypothetical protein